MPLAGPGTGHLVPPSAEAWLGPWLLPVCSELAGSCGPRRWRELGSYTGHFTHFSSSQNYRPAFLFSGLGKADLSPCGLGKEGKGLLWEGSFYAACLCLPSQRPLLSKALAFSKVWEKLPRKAQERPLLGLTFPPFHVVKKPL